MYYKMLLTKFTVFVTAGLMTLANLSADAFHARSEKQTSETYACEEEMFSYVETTGVMNQQSPDEARIDTIYNMAMAGNFSAASYEGLRPEPTQMTSEEAIAAGYLTPQQFRKPGDKDDTESFQRMFKAAADVLEGEETHNSFTMKYEYKKCKAIFIPSGEYVITATIIPHDSPIEWCAFEVSGAGRESTVIHFYGNGKVMFDDWAEKVAEGEGGHVHFAFTTFRDVCFDSDNLSTFMNIKDNRTDSNGTPISGINNSNGVQRMQFISCSFLHWHTIIHTIRSEHMLSEFTFGFCRIENCGTAGNKCELFYLNDPESVDWRFVYTDIEGIVGTAFRYHTGIGLCLIGGSVIIENGIAFDFDLYEEDDTAGQANSPHLHCVGTRFEIKAYQKAPKDEHSTLIRTKTKHRDKPNVVFDTCTFSSASDDNQSWRFFDINGGANVIFENCYDCSGFSLTGDFSSTGLINPCLRFINCPSFSPERFLERSTQIKNAVNSQNYCHVIVDDTYDFYVKGVSGSGATYDKTFIGLHECRQNVKLTDFSTLTMKNGKSFPNKKNYGTGVETLTPVKPYGLVKYVELSVLKNDTYKNFSPVTLTFYDGDKQIGEPVELSYTTTQTHMIVINDFVDNLTFKVSHSNSTNPELCINMTVVKY